MVANQIDFANLPPIQPFGVAPPPLQPFTYWNVHPPDPKVTEFYQFECPPGRRMTITFVSATFFHSVLGNATELQVRILRNGNSTSFTTATQTHLANATVRYTFFLGNGVNVLNKQLARMLVPLPFYMILEPGDIFSLDWINGVVAEQVSDIHVSALVEQLAPERSRFRRIVDAFTR